MLIKRLGIVLFVIVLLTTACGTGESPDAPSTVAATTAPTGAETPAPDSAAATPLSSEPPAPDAGLIATLVAVGDPEIIQTLPAPDGQRRAEVWTYPCVEIADGGRRKVEELRIVEDDDDAGTVVASRPLGCEGLGAAGLGPLFWSPEGDVLYYTDAREGVPDGGGGFCWDRPLWAYNLASDNAQQLTGIWALSPDETRVAMWVERNILIMTLDRTSTDPFPLAVPNAQVCQIVWSPGSQAIAYLQSPDPHGTGPFTLAYLNPQAERPIVLTELEGSRAVSASWDRPTEIDMSGYEGEIQTGWTYDLTTGRLLSTR